MMDVIFSGFVQFFTVLVSFFPMADVSVTSEISSFVNSFRTGLSFIGVFVPLPLLLWGLGTILTIELGIFSFKVWRWIASNVSMGFLK